MFFKIIHNRIRLIIVVIILLFIIIVCRVFYIQVVDYKKLNKYAILKYIDMIGTILIGIMVLITAIKILINNSLSLIGEIENNEEAINKIKNYLGEFNAIKDQEITLIKYGSYYKLQLIIELDSKMSLRKITNLENKIRKGIIKHIPLN